MNEILAGDHAPPPDSQYRLLVDAITDYAIFMLNPDGIVTNWNAGALRLKGYVASEIIGSHFSRFYTAQDCAAGVPARALQTAAREGKFEAEGWRIRKDGSRFWAGVVITPIRDETGSIIGFAKITRDLSERKLAMETLRRSDEQFRLLVQNVADEAIYLLDVNGNVSSWNAGAEHIKGYLAGEIVGKPYEIFFNDEDRDAGLPARALDIARKTGRYTAEGRRVRKDGREFQASVVIDPIFNDEGLAIGFAKLTRDVTQHMRVQQELGKAREALVQSQKLKAIGQLTGGIAHDFNNLLAAILGSLELFGKRLGDDPVGRKLLANAVSGAERGASLTSRMLAFARRQNLNAVRVDLPQVVLGMTDMLQRTLAPLWVIDTRIPQVGCAVIADVNQLEMALLNLVVNARDAMPQGGTITIEAREHAVSDGGEGTLAAGRYVALSVIDSGTGMDADTLAHAMEPFFTTKGIGKGTGLGLSMIHGFAEQGGGKFQLASQPGVGTTAEIWLPAAIASTTVASVATPEILTVGAALAILVVDDDALILMNTVAMLEDMGHTVLEAYSGAEALKCIRSTPGLDLVITDYAMPGMTGAELIDTVSAEFPAIPVVLATGYGELPFAPRASVRRLAKPFTQKDLERAVSTATRVGQ